MLARHAEANDAIAARIGGEITADDTGIAGAEVKPEEKPCFPAAAWMTLSGVPACTVIVAMTGSISSIPFMRSSDSATPLSIGRAPPASPVNLPCGTTGTRKRSQSRSVAETCSVVRGRTKASGNDRLKPGPVIVETCRDIGTEKYVAAEFVLERLNEVFFIKSWPRFARK